MTRLALCLLLLATGASISIRGVEMGYGFRPSSNWKHGGQLIDKHSGTAQHIPGLPADLGYAGGPAGAGVLFPPSENAEHVKQTSDLHKQWVPVLNELGIRRRPPYNCRHTYATICLMSGLNPAFIAQQLGHSVQMLLSTYARWLNSSSDWSELEKLKIGIKSVSA